MASAKAFNALRIAQQMWRIQYDLLADKRTDLRRGRGHTVCQAQLDEILETQ